MMGYLWKGKQRLLLWKHHTASQLQETKKQSMYFFFCVYVSICGPYYLRRPIALYYIIRIEDEKSEGDVDHGRIYDDKDGHYKDLSEGLVLAKRCMLSA